MREQWQTLRRVLQYYPRVFALIWQTNPGSTLVIFGLTVVNALARPAQIWLVKVIIDRVNLLLAAADPNTAVDWPQLITPAALFALVLILGDVSQSLVLALRTTLGEQADYHVRGLLLAKASTLDIAFFETPAFYDQLENAQSDSWRMRNLPWILVDTSGQMLSLLATFGLLARLNPLIIPLLLLTSLPQLVTQAQRANAMFKVWTERAPTQRMVYYLVNLLSQRESVKEVRLFGLQAPFLQRYFKYSHQFIQENKALAFRYERVNLLTVLLSVFGIGIVWAYGIFQAALARITLGDLALIFQAAQQIRSGLGSLFHTMGVFYEHSLFVSNLYHFLDLAPDAVDGALQTQGVQKVSSPLVQGIEFRNVSFRYPGTERAVLNNVSFTIQPRATVAVVGENGAGKTTLIKLLTRFYDPTAGEILLDGRDLRDYDLADLRRQIGVIFQDFVRYDLTAKENIGFGQVEYLAEMDRIVAAAGKGGAVPVIEKLAEKYETTLGRTFENGADLSGGEWQKLALSRAFMRDAQILILDEPTAALDALAEYEVYNRFAELTTGKTTIFISHRFSTVRMAQQILVLDDGQLIEEGSHVELMAQNGQYARMFSAQAERYQ
ncbi:MAG: ABC transporter ATP-binding protein [Caldilineaceae bacterium]